jgi:germination protein M
MSREPFDEMKQKNPVAPDRLPGAPMSVAERIVARRVRHTLPGWAMAAVAAVLVAVVGFGLLWFLDGGNGAEVAGGDTTMPPTVTTEAMVASPGAVYFFADTDGPGRQDGPFLIPVARTINGSDPIGSALQALFEGPSGDEATSGLISTAIPEGSWLDYGISDDEPEIVIVHMSAEFVSGGGTLSMMGRLGQVVLTLDRLEGIDGVRFYVEGVPTTVFGGEGIIVNDPATAADFEGLLPAVMIESPAFGARNTTNPLIVAGTANVFEATVSLALTDADGLIIWEGFTTATCGTGCRGEWEITIPYEVDAPQMGSLAAWESSAMDGSQTNVREHPLWLVPAAGETTTTLPDTTCSGAAAAPDLVEQPELPAVIDEKRAAIFAAARVCDWPTLASLLGDPFSFTFGIDEDPIAYWQEREAAGDDVMYRLAELLNRSFGVIYADATTTYHVWPLAFLGSWSELPEAAIEELRPLYDDDDFAGFADFGGYIGYRVGILEDGTWVYFIAGD